MAEGAYRNRSQVKVGDKEVVPGVGVLKAGYTLLTAAAASGEAVGPIVGGDYIWRCEGNFGGGTATLKFLGLDGVTWYPVRNAANSADLTMTATGQVGLGVSQGTYLRVDISGQTGASLHSALGGL